MHSSKVLPFFLLLFFSINTYTMHRIVLKKEKKEIAIVLQKNTSSVEFSEDEQQHIAREGLIVYLPTIPDGVPQPKNLSYVRFSNENPIKNPILEQLNLLTLLVQSTHKNNLVYLDQKDGYNSMVKFLKINGFKEVKIESGKYIKVIRSALRYIVFASVIAIASVVGWRYKKNKKG